MITNCQILKFYYTKNVLKGSIITIIIIILIITIIIIIIIIIIVIINDNDW